MHTINGKPLGGILTWTSHGHRGVCGQTMGADGAGEFALLMIGTPMDAEKLARDHIRKMEQAGHQITRVSFIPNDEDGGYFGNPIYVVEASEVKIDLD